MKRERQDDPVDLIMLGKVDEAAKIYLDMYAEAVKEGDGFIGPFLLSQLHFCVAGKESGRVPEESADEVSRMVFDKLHEKGIKGKERIVWDEIAIAKEKITADRRESARALKQVRDR